MWGPRLDPVLWPGPEALKEPTIPWFCSEFSAGFRCATLTHQYKLSFFVSTDFEPYKFINCEFQNCTFLHNKTGCYVTFEDDYGAYWIYFVNFLGTLAVLPGNIVSALLMDRIGRLTMLGMCLVSCKIQELPLQSRGSLSPAILPTPLGFASHRDEEKSLKTFH